MIRILATSAVIGLAALLVGIWVFTGFRNSDDLFASCRASVVAGGAGQSGGPFTLVDSKGNTVTDQDVLTEPSLVYFGYTFCPDVCPFDLSRNAEAIDILEEEGLENVFARHKRHSEATRLAVNTWGLEILCRNADEYSSSLTAIMMPEGHSADNYRRVVLERFNMSLGSGLGKVADKIFRIGHLGDFNDLTLLGTLAGVEMGLVAANVPHTPNGVKSAMDFLAK